ncbi:MAG: RluA family pseudouridine synthase [Erysipelotrichaceae bacterium]|jgi:23S rRNA pseudouridine1911/1915/1917 synthase|nr:RluA family pseudouridine synthase [Erysipelotrichaceae bacterium]
MKEIKKDYPKKKTAQEFVIHKNAVPLLEFLLEKLSRLSRNNVKSLLSRKQVLVNGAIVTAFDYSLVKEDVVTITPYSNQELKAMKLPVIYEDDDLLVLDKPAGILSVESDQEKGKTMFNMASKYLAIKEPKKRLYILHRLDKDTSGVLAFAKNNKFKTIMHQDWNNNVFRRKYYAIVVGNLSKKSATLTNYLGENNLNLVFVSNNPHDKKAVLTYKVIKENKDYSLLEVMLQTGRKNQIRVQLGHIGHHVIGDQKYGKPQDPLHRLGLHEAEFGLIYPETGKKYLFKSKLPSEFTKLFS